MTGFVPGMAANYALYVLLITLIAPGRAPALPIEARTLGSGVISLVIALALAIGVGVAGYYFFSGNPQWRPVTAFFTAVIAAYAMALSNRSSNSYVKPRL